MFDAIGPITRFIFEDFNFSIECSFIINIDSQGEISLMWSNAFDGLAFSALDFKKVNPTVSFSCDWIFIWILRVNSCVNFVPISFNQAP